MDELHHEPFQFAFNGFLKVAFKVRLADHTAVSGSVGRWRYRLLATRGRGAAIRSSRGSGIDRLPAHHDSHDGDVLDLVPAQRLQLKRRTGGA